MNIPAEVVGIPLIVTIFPFVVWLIPAGKPVTITPVAHASKVYWIGTIGELTHIIWLVVVIEEVRVSVGSGVIETKVVAGIGVHPPLDGIV